MKQKYNLYLSNGYFNADSIMNSKNLYTWVVGGKGMGKTFNVIAWLLKHDKSFIFIRRLQTEIAKASSRDVGDIAKVMDFYHIKDDYRWGKIDDLTAIYKGDKLMIVCGSLKTMGKLTGINLEPFEYIVFDEFIAKPMENKVKGESEALPVLFDTAMRNKELDGRTPTRLIALANSYSINNPQFMCYDLVSEAERLSAMPADKEYITKGSHIIFMPKNSPILKAKAEAESIKNTSKDFTDMSISNRFVMNDFTYVKKKNIKDYQCICNVGYLYIYAHKSNYDIYVTKTKGRCSNDRVYMANITGLERFKRREYRLWNLYLDGFINFDSYDSLSKFEYYFDK